MVIYMKIKQNKIWSMDIWRMWWKWYIQTLKENQHVYKYGFCVKKFYNSTSKTFYDLNDDGFYYPYLQINSNKEKFEHYRLLIQKSENN